MKVAHNFFYFISSALFATNEGQRWTVNRVFISSPYLSDEEPVVIKDFLQMSKTWHICQAQHKTNCPTSHALINGQDVQLGVACHVVEESPLFQKVVWRVEFHDWSIVKNHNPGNKDQSISIINFGLLTLCFKNYWRLFYHKTKRDQLNSATLFRSNLEFHWRSIALGWILI